MTGLVLQTQEDAPAGLLEGWAQRRGFALDTLRVDGEAAWPEPRAYDFVATLGSSASVAGGGPGWVARTIDFLRAADAADVPVLGICFGAQALAAALGGSVHKLATPEVGWVTVTSNDADRIPSGPWLAWHEDGFTLPPLGYELAANAFGCQAFCLTRHLGVQFHPEVTAGIVAGWTRADHEDLARAGVTAADLDPQPHAAEAARAAEVLFDGFAARAGLVAVASGA
ncbi:gamma-glutamyl-gamma-aminobutyrate hydrolase family protein [Solirubrobacter phytolaccae]|uniref:Gamma-glutamyl-gamma-aminobutyrate hydrolase family protein n=1 Tax=Solirubrobacter phytolaccae TaxID=1404360 RepID=A0A9X3S746_9ACTN|nr:gamma-glutamyl-gamma-aminobutyrate hydrolase family protein [Solirubrobacter phytolaccae]MDA0179883.1 gamma-glutamyl-gamma-aminobutyrate hydrolase family protein [Solirubrobacter phytolaccae]